MSIIYSRRSVRKYQQREVEDELVTELLRAAMHAPSAGNAQPWHFIV
ncbi:nitroreductase family protein, partial [Pseudothermotoga sp.]